MSENASDVVMNYQRTTGRLPLVTNQLKRTWCFFSFSHKAAWTIQYIYLFRRMAWAELACTVRKVFVWVDTISNTYVVYRDWRHPDLVLRANRFQALFSDFWRLVQWEIQVCNRWTSFTVNRCEVIVGGIMIGDKTWISGRIENDGTFYLPSEFTEFFLNGMVEYQLMKYFEEVLNYQLMCCLRWKATEYKYYQRKPLKLPRKEQVCR